MISTDECIDATLPVGPFAVMDDSDSPLICDHIHMLNGCNDSLQCLTTAHISKGTLLFKYLG